MYQHKSLRVDNAPNSIVIKLAGKKTVIHKFIQTESNYDLENQSLQLEHVVFFNSCLDVFQKTIM